MVVRHFKICRQLIVYSTVTWKSSSESVWPSVALKVLIIPSPHHTLFPGTSTGLVVIAVLLLQQQGVRVANGSYFLVLLPREFLCQLLELFPGHFAHILHSVSKRRIIVALALLARLFLFQCEHKLLEKPKIRRERLELPKKPTWFQRNSFINSSFWSIIANCSSGKSCSPPPLDPPAQLIRRKFGGSGERRGGFHRPVLPVSRSVEPFFIVLGEAPPTAAGDEEPKDTTAGEVLKSEFVVSWDLPRDCCCCCWDCCAFGAFMGDDLFCVFVTLLPCRCPSGVSISLRSFSFYKEIGI